VKRTLLVTEHALPTPRLLFAIRWAHAHSERPPVLATLSHPPGNGVAHAHRAGVLHIGLGSSGAPTLEAALSGLCRSLDISDVIVWDAPRAIGALRSIRDIPGAPTVHAHIAPTVAVAWDELNIMSIRARNVIDSYLVEDEQTATELERFRLGRHVRLLTPRESAAREEVQRPGEPLVLVTGATWRRETHAPPSDDAMGISTRAFPDLMWDLVGDGPQSGTFVFPDPNLASAAPVMALREAGCRVQVSRGGIETVLTEGGIAERLPESLP
jgi:hypothetical protein